MTIEEAARVLLVLSRVDGCCSTCARDAVRDARGSMPEAPWVQALASILPADWGKGNGQYTTEHARAVTEMAQPLDPDWTDGR